MLIKMNRKAAALGYVCLAGCVAAHSTAPTPVKLPDGATGYALHCAGQRADSSDCVNQAVKVCSGLYAVVDPDRGSDVTLAMPADNRAGRTLTIRCLPP